MSDSDFLEKYSKDYQNIVFLEETKFSKIYKAYNIVNARECCLKVINKEELKKFDYDYLLEQINREEEITKLCSSENIVNLYQKLETEHNIIFELELCEIDLAEYIKKNGKLQYNKELFYSIILDVGTALKKMNEMGVMHRDIKPNNIFIKSKKIKLGDFGCSIFIKDNNFEQVGTIFYTAPEILQDLNYDEKCDLWSLGVTLYEIYFGVLPFGDKITINSVKKILSKNKKLNLLETGIPNLDILFNSLLTIEPKDRINYKDFFDFIFKKMNKEENIINSNNMTDNMNNSMMNNMTGYMNNNMMNNMMGNMNYNMMNNMTGYMNNNMNNNMMGNMNYNMNNNMMGNMNNMMNNMMGNMNYNMMNNMMGNMNYNMMMGNMNNNVCNMGMGYMNNNMMNNMMMGNMNYNMMNNMMMGNMNYNMCNMGMGNMNNNMNINKFACMSANMNSCQDSDDEISILFLVNNRKRIYIQLRKSLSLKEMFRTFSQKLRINEKHIGTSLFFLYNGMNLNKISEKTIEELLIMNDNTITVLDPNDITTFKKEKANKIFDIIQEEILPDLMAFSNGLINEEEKFNNIIYYDENIDHLNSINKDSDYFERNTSGAFILCSNIESLKLIRDEILSKIKKDKRMSFNLITTGSKFEKVMKFLNEDENIGFKNCIKNACIYCMKVDKYLPLKNQYPILHDNIYNKQKDVVNNFINKYSSTEIKSYPLTRLLTLADYEGKYKDRHIKISQFYGNLNPETYKKNINQMVSNIDEQKIELNKKKEKVLEGLFTFDIDKDLEFLDKKIIKEYTKNTFYYDLNKMLMNYEIKFESIAYFTSRLMYSLNRYASIYDKYCTENEKIIYRGTKLKYTDILPYKRAKGKIILLSAFTSTTEDESFAQRWSSRQKIREVYKSKLLFSVVFYIKNNYKSNWISNGINIQEESQYKNEKEILFQPFSFYYVKDVSIDLKNYTADIYLETIGKVEILEEQIKNNKDIEYNKKENIIQIKN